MRGIKRKLDLTWHKGITAIYQVLGKHVKLTRRLKALAERGQAGAEEWWTLGILYLRSQEWERAVHAMLNAVRLGNNAPQYLYWLGKAEEKAGHETAAEALYDRVMKIADYFWEAYAAKAQLLLNRGDYSEALVYFTEALILKPDDLYLLNNIGLCFLGMEELNGAKQYLQEAVARKPLDDYLHYNYGTVLVSLGEYDSAITQFTMIMNKDDAALQNVLGYCYGMLQEYEESINCYQEALRLDPGNLEWKKNLAAIYARANKYEQAVQLMKDLLLVNPQDSEILNNLAWIYEAQSQYSEAEENYYRGLAASDGSPDIAYNLICCLQRQKKYMEALELTGYLQKIPEKQRFYWSAIGQIYEDFGAGNLAVDCYNKSLGLE